MIVLWTVIAIVGIAACAGISFLARKRNVHLWLPSYVKGNWAGRRERDSLASSSTIHVMFCMADHFEPGWGDPGIDEERRRVEHWLTHYPQFAADYRDADGRPPRQSIFFPAEEYRPEHIDRLGALVQDGFAEIEIHLHHDRDTSDGLRGTLLNFVSKLRGHGHLGENRVEGLPRFGFVHGNWALDNSRSDGRWCGVNDELHVLSECGCYADFTLPSAPSDTQTRRINSIYYAADDPRKPRSHDDGVEVRVGGNPSGDLMLIQGPLGVRWTGGRFGILPRLDAGNLAGMSPPTPQRFATWLNTRVCVAGRPEWLFVKVHTHGCNPGNWDAILGSAAHRLHTHLCKHYNDGSKYKLHYVTAREMYNIIKAAELGLEGEPGEYRDLEIVPPPCVALRLTES